VQSFEDLTDHISSMISQVAPLVGQLLNSNFSAAIAGAFAGAVASVLIVERGARRRELLLEIRSTNAAIMVAFTIVNSLISLKGQHIKKLGDTLKQQRAELDKFEVRRKKGELAQGEFFQFDADFQTVALMETPIDVLRGIAFDKLTLEGRPLMLLAMLAQSLNSLEQSISDRTAVIREFQANSPNPPKDLVCRYFGLPLEGGHVDARYPSSVNAISHYTDDCLFFGTLLIEDLHDHGKSIRERQGWKEPAIALPNFDTDKSRGLLPDRSQYSDWVNMKKAIKDAPKRQTASARTTHN
jgi:hypothetical protein